MSHKEGRILYEVSLDEQSLGITLASDSDERGAIVSGFFQLNEHILCAERLRKIAEYELQYVFNCDGWFLLHCITALLENGKLKPPTEGQKKSLMTLIISEK